MARDDTARENESESSLLDRRSYLKLAGAAAASVAAAGVSSNSAKAASYETIEVSAGSTERIEVGPGETFENKLIDISADGAHFRLLTQGSDWTIRNVGVKGTNDDQDGTKATMYLRCTDGGTAVAENVYMGDGSEDRVGHAAVSDWENSGTVKIRNFHVAGWAADGMYMSHAGVSESHGMGETQIESSYLKNNNIENCRLGTPGSYIKDSVIHVEGESAVSSNESGQKNPRGLWFKEQSGMKAVNCDIKVNGSAAVMASDNGSGTVKDCRIDGDISSSVEQVNVSGSPDVSAPKGVPMTAEEAASGKGGTSGKDRSSSGESDSTDTTTGDAEQGKVFQLIADEDGVADEYQFTVDGSVSPQTDPSANMAEESDSVEKNDDGTVTVSGSAMGGFGDSFLVTGDFVSFDLNEDKWTLRYDGEEVSVSDLVLPNLLVIDGSTPNSPSSYEFSVSGEANKSAAHGSVNANDSAKDGSIAGQVYAGTDAYRFSGEITAFSLDGPANVRVEDNA
ncbi:right-handed parallel beta-helix repeat-containing protein [Halorussus halophilus]|uniref:right-handed parallel beta-helix repeat-containing protein n=1 Tax=Halorussus halophilus TaxID=2650975 RepID=UPI001300F8CF|nr:right-handed parallel beta-helix repeat-containing protein [Halorussus halophilus]